MGESKGEKESGGGGALEEEENRNDYIRGIKEKWREVLRSEVEDVEEEWNKLKIALVGVARSVCGVKKIGNGRRKGSEWWNDDLEKMVKRKKDALTGTWVQRKHWIGRSIGRGVGR